MSDGFREPSGTRKDGVAVLFEKSVNSEAMRANRAVYVRHDASVRLEHIPTGTYTLRFILGVNWSSAERRFRADVEAYEFRDTLQFEETETSGGIRYNQLELTLHKVFDGNAPSNAVDPTFVRFDDLADASTLSVLDNVQRQRP